jgi:hypothetical protein
MTLQELTKLASKSPLNAPDMGKDDSIHAAALTSHCGKLLTVMTRLAQTPENLIAKEQALKHSGAAMLVLASIMDRLGLEPEQAIMAGGSVLQ